MKNEVRFGDIGTVFRVTIQDNGTAVDISAATTRQIIFSKPDTTTLTRTATLTGTGTDGRMEYVTVSGDLSVLGEWRLQGRVAFGSSQDWKSDIYKFIVHPNLT
jgi:hypothetical protein